MNYGNAIGGTGAETNEARPPNQLNFVASGARHINQKHQSKVLLMIQTGRSPAARRLREVQVSFFRPVTPRLVLRSTTLTLSVSVVNRRG